MKVLIFIVVVGIASVVFYLFLRKVFDERLDKVNDVSGKDKNKSLLPEEAKKDETFKQDDVEEQPKEEQQSKTIDNCCETTIAPEQHDEREEKEQINL